MFAALMAMILVAALPGLTQDQQDVKKAETAPVKISQSYYPDQNCLIRDKPLEKGKVIVHEHAGRKVKVCCKKCLAKFAEDPAKYLAKLDEKIIHAQLSKYPLANCPISGEKLGSMGKPYQLVLEDRLVQLCCGGCKKKARAQSSKIVAQLNRALVSKQGNLAASCPVSGKKIKAGKGVNMIFGTDVVRLCCKNCIKKFEKAPQSYLRGTASATEHDDHEHGEKGKSDKKHEGSEGKVEKDHAPAPSQR